MQPSRLCRPYVNRRYERAEADQFRPFLSKFFDLRFSKT